MIFFNKKLIVYSILSLFLLMSCLITIKNLEKTIYKKNSTKDTTWRKWDMYIYNPAFFWKSGKLLMYMTESEKINSFTTNIDGKVELWYTVRYRKKHISYVF